MAPRGHPEADPFGIPGLALFDRLVHMGGHRGLFNAFYDAGTNSAYLIPALTLQNSTSRTRRSEGMSSAHSSPSCSRRSSLRSARTRGMTAEWANVLRDLGRLQEATVESGARPGRCAPKPAA